MTRKGNQWFHRLAIAAFGVSMLAGISECAGMAGGAPPPSETTTKEVGPLDLRGYGRVSAEGSLWREKEGDTARVSFHCQDAESAKILASKYLADMLAYGAVKVVETPKGLSGTALEVRHGGIWLIGVDGKDVAVASAPTRATLAKSVKSRGGDKWLPVQPQAYPQWLDCFDNAALGYRWKPNTKTPEQLAWFKDFPAAANVHTLYELTRNPAPGVYDNSGSENALAQLRQIGKPNRYISFSTTHGDGLWWNWLRQPGHQVEEAPAGFTGESFLEEGGYYLEQTASPMSNAILQDSLVHLMRKREHPGVLGWMEPHGEFQLKHCPYLPPGYQSRFPAYLQMVKKYSLETISEAYAGNRKAYPSWDKIHFPDSSYFQGRRDMFLDLDDKPWRWCAGPLEDGEKNGWGKPDFDDSGWGEDRRESKLLLSQSASRTNPVYPLWYRFTRNIPESFLGQDRKSKVFLHIMPYTLGKGMNMSVWVNGQKIAGELTETKKYYMDHCQVEISKELKTGDNHFAIYSNGGRIAYRVFLSHVSGERYPFADPQICRQYLDWIDYLRWEKMQMLENYLRVMRSVDPNRPISVMTPGLFQSDAWEIFERYGAYPFLTGEGAFYRPYNYKGYTSLRRMPSGGEPGGPHTDARYSQFMFAMIFWESQDIHDHVFDLAENWKADNGWVKWWSDNKPLLRTLGKTDFADFKLGVLRDVRQNQRYYSWDIFNWDISRGVLPAMGLTPVLVDGPELMKGLADNLPVIFDCATTTMEPAMVDAILRYVEKGGVFVAQYHTGQNLVDKQNTYPLATALGLKVAPKLVAEGSVHKWPMGKIHFTSEQSLIPSLRGKDYEAGGVSISHLGVEETGAIGLEKNQNSKKSITTMATYDDGSMAIAEVKHGKGRFIYLGTPFYLGMKDSDGKWLNDAKRQDLLEEMLVGLGVRRETRTEDDRIWFERRESKNGLYDTYIACAMGVKDKEWKLEDRIESDLRIVREQPAPVVEITDENMSDVSTASRDGWLDFGKQIFSPYQVRQWAMLRKDVGLDAPFHWLETQRRHWRALENVPSSLAVSITGEAAKIADEMQEAGLDISEGWKVRLNTTDHKDESWISAGPAGQDWKDGGMGSWLSRGWNDAACAQYRKRVELPGKWRDKNKRILLGIMGYQPHMTILGKGSIWVNGKQLDSNMSGYSVYDVTDKTGNVVLDIALQVNADRGLDRGPMCTMYLRSVPVPNASADISSGWLQMADWTAKEAGQIVLPLDGKATIFGLKRKVAIPKEWAGKQIRLVIDSGQASEQSLGCIINRTGYFNSSEWHPFGSRIDKWLRPGEENELILLGTGHMSGPAYKGWKPTIRAIHLEVMP
ncbi:MAG: hypothetical protein WAX69_13510 [Victivallales bacterium]